MYIFSFFKSLFKPKNALPTIYFFVNAAIVFFLFYILPFRFSDNEQMDKIYLGLIGLGVNLVFILISLTPFGEAFWRIRNRIKKQPKENNSELQQDWQAANEAFEEVKAKAGEFTKHVSDKVKLYYSPSNDINAYALGHRTVIVTKGILGANPEYLKGVLAHELGHIAHGDSDLKLGINVSNSILTVFLTVLSIFANMIIGVMQIFEKSSLAAIVTLILHVAINVVIIGLFNLWNLVGVLFINWSSRKAEYAADGFANQLGYGEQLALFLNILDGDSAKSSKFDLMFQSHPDTQDRLAALGYAVQ